MKHFKDAIESHDRESNIGEIHRERHSARKGVELVSRKRTQHRSTKRKIEKSATVFRGKRLVSNR